MNSGCFAKWRGIFLLGSYAISAVALWWMETQSSSLVTDAILLCVAISLFIISTTIVLITGPRT
jgi:hypothetical protein